MIAELVSTLHVAISPYLSPILQYPTSVQKPSIEERVQASVPSCESLLNDIKQGKKPERFVFWGSVEDAIKHFPQEGLKKVGEVVDNFGPYPFTNIFYQYPKYKGWDVAIIAQNGIPLMLYYAKGNILDEKYNMVSSHDITIHFKMGPENAMGQQFNLYKLKDKKRISGMAYVCIDDIRKQLDAQYEEMLKQQEKNLSPPVRPHNDKPKIQPIIPRQERSFTLFRVRR